jgi:hypothetical protein
MIKTEETLVHSPFAVKRERYFKHVWPLPSLAEDGRTARESRGTKKEGAKQSCPVTQVQKQKKIGEEREEYDDNI